MGDDDNEKIDQGQTEYDTTDAEAPLVIHPHPAKTDTAGSSKKSDRAKHYIEVGLHGLRRFGVELRHLVVNANFWNAFSTVVLAAVGIVGVYIYNGQLQQMRSSGEQTERVIILTRGQVALANRTAKTTEDAVAESHNQTILANRAWVKPVYSVDGVSVVANQAAREPFTIQNIGKGPASQIEGFVVSEFLKINQVPTFAYTKGHPRSFVRVGILFPETVPHQPPWTISPLNGDATEHVNTVPDVIEFNLGKRYIALHGEIGYFDLLSRKTHWIRFCSYSMAGDPANLPQNVANACNSWNTVDPEN